MNSLKVPESGLLLEGPSNADVVSPPQAFVLSLSDDIVAGLIQSARAGEDLHIALGSTPVCWLLRKPLQKAQEACRVIVVRPDAWPGGIASLEMFLIPYRQADAELCQALHFGRHSHRITPPADDVPYDLYLTKPFESTRKAERLSHTSSLFKKPPVTASQKKKTASKATKESEKRSNGVSTNGKSSTPSALDSDIEALQNGLAAHDAARDRSRMVGKPPASMKTQEKMKSTKLLASYNSASKSIPNSPALHNSAPSPSSAPTLSASQQVVERKKEQRVVLVHELAVKDRTTEYLREKWTAKEGDFRPTLEKTADFITESKRWAMKKSCWKELDVWKYDYEFQDERQMAIDNAIRQYDRQRLSSSEVEWQRLLPVEERGKGKCLSRLQANLAKGLTQPTPKIKVQRADDSSGSKDDGDDLDGEKPRPVAESMSRLQSNPLPVKPKEPSAQEAQFKRLLGNSKAKSVAPKVPSTKAKAAPKGAKTTGRVLSAAIIENSDSSGDEAMRRKTRTTAPTPKDTVIVKMKPLQREPASKQHRLPASATVSTSAPPPVRAPAKRIREDDDSSSSSGTPLSKRIKTKQPMAPPSTQLHRTLKTVPPVRSAGVSSAVKNKKTSPTKSSPLASSPPTNASELDEESPPAPVRKRKVESETKPVPVKRRVVESVPTEVLTKAHKFKTYYQKYEALHWEISGLDDPPSEKLADLLDMRGRLQSMKDEIYKQYSPDRG